MTTIIIVALGAFAGGFLLADRYRPLPERWRAFSLRPDVSCSQKARGFEGGYPMPTMDTRTWIIVAIAVLVILVAGYYFLRPAAETPTEAPAATEQPAEPAPSN